MKIYIYLTTTEINTLKKIQQKYLVSLSTICDKVIFNFLKAFNKTEDEDKNEDVAKDIIQKKYIYSIKENNRTTIKPRIYKHYPSLDQHLATTCLKLYANKDFKRVFKDKKTIDQMLSGIDIDLIKTYDHYYNYNETLRNSIRVIKENKDYIERLRKEKV